jgi:hypothetical protein
MAFTKVLIANILKFTPSTILLYLPFPPSINSFNRYLFFHLHSCVHNIRPHIPFPHLLPLPLISTPINQAGPVAPSCSLILQKKERKKKWHFCLFKTVTQGISLWHVHVYMYYSPVYFISFIFLLSTLVPFLWLFLNILCSFLCRECINHIHLNFFLIPSPSCV